MCCITEDEFSLTGDGRVLRLLPVAQHPALRRTCWGDCLSLPLAGEDLRLFRRIPAHPSPERGNQLAMGQIEDQWIYLNDPIPDGSGADAEPP